MVYMYLNLKDDYDYDWSIIYANICIVLYATYTIEMININYKNWPVY